jgi:RNA polymerase sigma-70 factor (ECF subfamily)
VTDSEGSRARFETLYRAHYRQVLAYGRRRGAPDAEELAAEVFVLAWQKFDRLPDPALPWLYRAAHLCLANAYRRRDTQRALPHRFAADRAVGPQSTGVPAEQEPARDDQLLAALASLAAGDREILQLSSWEQLAGDELATAVGCRPGAARVRLHRARERLRAALTAPPGPTNQPTTSNLPNRTEAAR